jgi:hypothetical protein
LVVTLFHDVAGYKYFGTYCLQLSRSLLGCDTV